MSGLIFNLGRGLGYATIPALRKSRQVWRSLAGIEAESIRAETEFGQALAAELRLRCGVRNENDDALLLRGIVTRLGPCVRNKARMFQVEVLRYPKPAAIPLPGGFLFITMPLLDLSGRCEDELAFILGHELGHVVRGHAMDRLRGRIGAEGLSSVVSRGLLNPALRDAELDWLEMAHAPEAEAEADEFGARIARAAGYDPGAALHWLERLRETRNSSSPEWTYISSHPPEIERMDHIRTLLNSKSRTYRRPPPPPPPPR